uniref:G-protein coupled receptors family 1 profile domain-containing protein n=1 Tax=Strongyloides venezuelensis TaxID=75913 RepID=A0A0K0F4N2_STRVS
MPLLRINILILSIAYLVQSILQGIPSYIYIFSYLLNQKIDIDICSAIRLFGTTVHGIVDFIPFSLAVIRYNLIFGKKNKKMWLFWISQIILVLIRLTNGIYPSIAKNSYYVKHSSCGYVKTNSDPFMLGLQIFSVTSEIIFPIIAFIINIVILQKVLVNLRIPAKENEKNEQKQLFWSMMIQILIPFFFHIPSINLQILRMTGFKSNVYQVIVVDTLNTIAYSSSVFLSIIFIKKLRSNLFNISC